MHYMINPIVEVDDDLVNAKGSWYLWQPCTLATPDGPKAIETISPFAEGWVKRPFWDEG